MGLCGNFSIGCSDQALMPRKRKILTHVWYQNKPHIKIFKDGFPNFSFYPPTAFWEGLKRGHKPIPKFVLSLPEKERVQHGDQSRECRAILRKPMSTVRGRTFPWCQKCVKPLTHRSTNSLAPSFFFQVTNVQFIKYGSKQCNCQSHTNTIFLQPLT